MFALVLIGAPGAGKTSVAEALSDLLAGDEVRHALIETEALTSAHPPLTDDQWLMPVQAICELYRRFAYPLLLVVATVESAAELNGLLGALGADEHAVVALRAAPATLRRRIVEREPEGWSGLDALVAATERIATAVDALDGVTLVLSTEDQAPPAVAARIRDAFPRALGAPGEPVDAVTEAIRTGSAGALEQILHEHPGLARGRRGPRTWLHVVTDWPGHVPEAAAKIRALVAAGADVDAPYDGPEHGERPLHWAASSDDVEALDALLDAGADIEAGGGVSATAPRWRTRSPSGNGRPRAACCSAARARTSGRRQRSASPTTSATSSPRPAHPVRSRQRALVRRPRRPARERRAAPRARRRPRLGWPRRAHRGRRPRTAAAPTSSPPGSANAHPAISRAQRTRKARRSEPFGVPPPGIEPGTFGLRVRCSAS